MLLIISLNLKTQKPVEPIVNGNILLLRIAIFFKLGLTVDIKISPSFYIFFALLGASLILLYILYENILFSLLLIEDISI